MYNANQRGRSPALEYGVQSNRDSIVKNAYNSDFLAPQNSISSILTKTSSVNRIKLNPIHSATRFDKTKSPSLATTLT